MDAHGLPPALDGLQCLSLGHLKSSTPEPPMNIFFLFTFQPKASVGFPGLIVVPAHDDLGRYSYWHYLV